MKNLLLSLVVVAMSVPALAGSHDYLTYAKYASLSDCANVTNLLKQISSPELQVKVTQSCKLHKNNKALNVVGRVVVAVGTWGVSEAACAVEHDCGNSGDYYEVEATLRAATGKASSGQPLAMAPADCEYYSKALNGVRFYAKTGRLQSSCSNGVFAAALVPKK